MRAFFVPFLRRSRLIFMQGNGLLFATCNGCFMAGYAVIRIRAKYLQYIEYGALCLNL